MNSVFFCVSRHLWSSFLCHLCVFGGWVEASVGYWASFVAAERRDVWVREEWAGQRGVSGRAVRSGALRRRWRRFGVWVLLVTEPETRCPAAASWSETASCRICGGETAAWAERGPESECWAFCVWPETKRLIITKKQKRENHEFTSLQLKATAFMFIIH